MFSVLLIGCLCVHVHTSGVNHALGKYIQTDTKTSDTANHTVDGCITREHGVFGCCYVSTPTWQPWISVDLDKPIKITKLVIYGHLCSGRLTVLTCVESNPLWIRLSNTSDVNLDDTEEKALYTRHKLTPYIDGVFDIRYEPPVEARYAVVALFDITYTMVLCEVEVYGECADQYFGDMCQYQCHCRKGRPCAKTGIASTDGRCPPVGCELGWYGKRCDKPCDHGKYGFMCRKTCDKCYDMSCDHVNGTCLDGCVAGLQGETCDETCPVGMWGKKCLESCGQCYGACSSINGTCQGGCITGYNGPTCEQKCPIYTFGLLCSGRCGYCSENATCDHINGSCSEGCAPGWKGSLCHDRCPEGFYGINCSSACGYCVNSVCLKETGVCQKGVCMTGWQGIRCQTPCDNGTYGDACAFPCGHCNQDDTCNATTGVCMLGCVDGFIGSLCDAVAMETNVIVYVVPSSVVVIVATFITVCIYRYITRQKPQGSRTSSGRSMFSVLSSHI